MVSMVKKNDNKKLLVQFSYIQVLRIKCTFRIIQRQKKERDAHKSVREKIERTCAKTHKI